MSEQQQRRTEEIRVTCFGESMNENEWEKVSIKQHSYKKPAVQLFRDEILHPVI